MSPASGKRAEAPDTLAFTAEWMRLEEEEGDPEERATLGAIGLRVGGTWLSAGWDGFTGSFRNAPLVSGFHLAEWIAWNWWRLRWEPRPRAPNLDWGMAHNFASVGNGYVWPDLTIWSDGERIHLAARRSSGGPGSSYRYVCDFNGTVPPREFERAVDRFLDSVRGRMDRQGVRDSNLHALLRELRSDRRDPAARRRRKLEALLGFDTGEAEPKVLDTLVAEAAHLGEAAVDELAAAGIAAKRPGIAGKLEDLARDHGFEVSGRDGFRFRGGSAPAAPAGGAPAWAAGAGIARAVRREAALGDNPVSNRMLCGLAGVPGTALGRTPPRHGMSRRGMAFALEGGRTQRMVLCSEQESGRRFELARLVGDRLAGRYGDRLRPATRTRTCRQQLQRAFAAELLSPFEAVGHALAGDRSAEKRQRAAERFKVPPEAIRIQLAGRGTGGRDAPEANRAARPE